MDNPGDSNALPKWAQRILGLLGSEQSAVYVGDHLVESIRNPTRLAAFATTDSGPTATNRRPSDKRSNDMASLDHICTAYAESATSHFGMASWTMPGTSSNLLQCEEATAARVPIDPKSHINTRINYQSKS
ncbi:hypothetical protein NDU88_000782 [Pleurodeles waltl]|uniref:Uncharacterized protein n=1 Tax=Pleurodeles waltl TaxID=8319 RepID=A0AAV7V8H4_PLEWA|nr:hypothetical protein NDU88_000782 [Pleurodeles waltl]